MFTIQLEVRRSHLFLTTGMMLLLFSLLSQGWTTNQELDAIDASENYLKGKAAKHIVNVDVFYEDMKMYADKLDVPVQWMAAVIDHESHFNPKQYNHGGSGAVGLIQWMPTTCETFDIDYSKIAITHERVQLKNAYEYWDFYKQVKGKYRTRGKYRSLGDFYLAVLLPGARNNDTLYCKPSTKYRQNKGMDFNEDGCVTLDDVEKVMRKKYPTAAAISLKSYLSMRHMKEGLREGAEDALSDAKFSVEYAQAYAKSYEEALDALKDTVKTVH